MSGLIFKKMNDVMKEIGFVGKDQRNDQQKFMFRGIDQFVNALYPALSKHGVFMTTEVLDETHELKEVMRSSGKPGIDKHVSIKMKYTFHAEDGSSVSSSVPAEGLDTGDKATNKALSAALKYALIQTFSIPTADMEEADRTSPEIGVSTRSKVNLEAKSDEIDKTVTLTEKLERDGGMSAFKVEQGLTQDLPKSRTTFRKSAPVTKPTTSDSSSSGSLNF